jgi:hypothetical protein
MAEPKIFPIHNLKERAGKLLSVIAGQRPEEQFCVRPETLRLVVMAMEGDGRPEPRGSR